MEILGFALALAGFLLAAGVWFRSNKIAQEAALERRAIQQKLARVENHNKKAEAKARALSSRARELEKELAEAVARRDEKAMAKAMWALELERSYRQWRDVIVPDPNSERPNEATSGQQLAFAIGQEVERLREEVGVAIGFAGELTVELEAETALGALRIVEELLALAAKCADEIVVSVHQSTVGTPSISVVVNCGGWEIADDPAGTDLGTTIQGMARKLDGWVQWIRDGGNHLAITLHLPVDTEVVTLPAEPEAQPAT